MVPGAEIHIDRGNNRLMAFATRAEHEIIKSVIEKLGGPAAAGEAPVVEVYEITHSDPDSLKMMFESLFPGVQVNIDKATNNMVVFAYPSEHATIKSTLDRLMPPAVEPAGPRSATELRFYPFKDHYPPTLQSVLAGLVPGGPGDLRLQQQSPDRRRLGHGPGDHRPRRRATRDGQGRGSQQAGRLPRDPRAEEAVHDRPAKPGQGIAQRRRPAGHEGERTGHLGHRCTTRPSPASSSSSRARGRPPRASSSLSPIRSKRPTRPTPRKCSRTCFPARGCSPTEGARAACLGHRRRTHEQIKKSIAGITSQTPKNNHGSKPTRSAASPNGAPASGA